jgi:hypothetical protein
MYDLDQHYLEELEAIANEIQNSEELERYLDSEEEEDYARLKELFEPRIANLHDKVARENPLQIIAFEQVLLSPYFEGMFLPKILGYSVLRGEVNSALIKYVRPQEHFKAILLAICESSNFEILKKRIGQTIQMGFALSSDIWVTNLINGLDNKRVRYYLQGQKIDRLRRDNERAIALARYQNQFKNDHFESAEFPASPADLPVHFSPLKLFLIHRAIVKADNGSLLKHLADFVANESLHGTVEHLQTMALYGMFYQPAAAELKKLKTTFNKVRGAMPGFDEKFLQFILELQHHPELPMLPEVDQRMSEIVDKTYNDKLSEYYKLMDIIHGQGYINEPVHDAVKVFYTKNEGLSTINECVRQTITGYIKRFVINLEDRAYPDLFELAKQFPIYMRIFMNQQFNQDLKEIVFAKVSKLLVRFTDKRGKDYQDIKKFVQTVFLDLGFLKEKEIVEMFKTKRKKKIEV